MSWRWQRVATPTSLLLHGLVWKSVVCGDIVDDLLSFLTSTVPFTFRSTFEMIAGCSKHVPVVAIDPDLGIVVLLVITDVEGAGEGAAVF